MGDDPIAAGAENLAAWHGSSLLALGIESSEDEIGWWSHRPPPPIYHTFIALGRADAAEEHRRRIASLAEGGSRPMSVCDTWDVLDLRELGFRPMDPEDWFVRPGEPLPPSHPPMDLDIVEVTDEPTLASFERTSIDGFESPGLHALGSCGLHAPGILQDPAMHAFLGLVRGRPVVAAMAYESHGVIGVYGVATLPGDRRRGYARAITALAVGVRIDRPAVLQARAPASLVYRSLGFEAAGRLRNWVHPGPRQP